MSEINVLTEDLSAALDALIQTEQRKIMREYDNGNGKIERQAQWSTTPSLWDQLNGSTAYQGNGGAPAAKSRLPITAGVVDIIVDITTWAKEAADDFAGGQRDTIPGTLRAVVAAIPGQHVPGLAKQWLDRIRKWTHDARDALQLNPPHPRFARGVACPECGSTHAAVETDDGGRVATVKTPAIAINWSPPEDTTTYPADTWKVRAIECRACETVWWRGEPMEALIAQMLHANQTRETMTIDEGVCSDEAS